MTAYRSAIREGTSNNCVASVLAAENSSSRLKRLMVLASLSAALLLPVLTIHAQGSDRVTLNGRNVALYNLVGRLNVTGGGSSVVATITRRGRDAARLTVATQTVDGREALIVRYPSDRIQVPDSRNRRSRTELRVRDDGTFGNTYSNNGTRRSSRFNDGRNVRITSDDGGIEAAADIDLRVPVGTSVRLHVAIGDVDIRNVDGDIAVDVSSADLTVADTKGTLYLDTGSGRATMTNVSGNISLDTGSGDVRAQNLSGPDLVIDSGSGSVTLDGCACSKVRIETGSGDLRVTGMTATTLLLDTGSGSVGLGLRNTPESITIDSGSGDVRLTLPDNFSARVDIDTGSGDINSDFPIQMTSKSRGELHGRIGTGTARLVIDTGSGSVTLRKAN